MTEITGTLRNWTKDAHYNVIWGYLYDDVHKRWQDGTRIHTSNIVELDEAAGTVKTRNSFYKLEPALTGLAVVAYFRNRKDRAQLREIIDWIKRLPVDEAATLLSAYTWMNDGDCGYGAWPTSKDDEGCWQ